MLFLQWSCTKMSHHNPSSPHYRHNLPDLTQHNCTFGIIDIREKWKTRNHSTLTPASLAFSPDTGPVSPISIMLAGGENKNKPVTTEK
jgi:hypothetical protein